MYLCMFNRVEMKNCGYIIPYCQIQTMPCHSGISHLCTLSQYTETKEPGNGGSLNLHDHILHRMCNNCTRKIVLHTFHLWTDEIK